MKKVLFGEAFIPSSWWTLRTLASCYYVVIHFVPSIEWFIHLFLISPIFYCLQVHDKTQNSMHLIYLLCIRKFYNLMKSICFWSQASLCQFMFKELCSLLERNIQGFFHIHLSLAYHINISRSLYLNATAQT